MPVFRAETPFLAVLAAVVLSAATTLALYFLVTNKAALAEPAATQQFPYKNCHLESKPARTISAALTMKVKAPALEAVEWIYYAPLPPNLGGQQSLTRQEVLSDEMPAVYSKQEELSSEHRQVLLARIPVKHTQEKKSLYVSTHYFLDLNAISLQDGAAKIGAVAPLSPDDLAKYLAPSTTLDFKVTEFQNWLKSMQLIRRQDERDIDFAWRAYLLLRRSYTYMYDPKQDRRASSLCRIKSSDCGGLSGLFASTLRANGVPARLLVGRWLKIDAEADEPGNGFGQVHAKSEFYAKNVGWVPVDMSIAVSNPSDDPLCSFGKFNGGFVVFHIDPDLVLNSIWFGKSEITWMQGPLYWVTGGGSLDGAKVTSYWQTRD